jgi:hypothetical protein
MRPILLEISHLVEIQIVMSLFLEVPLVLPDAQRSIWNNNIYSKRKIMKLHGNDLLLPSLSLSSACKATSRGRHLNSPFRG